MKQWYEELFENFTKKYATEEFTQGTAVECDFIEKEINHNKKLKILDIGCYAHVLSTPLRPVKNG